MLYELRLYDLAAGRGADMEHRMLDDLLRLFRRHSVPLAGAWTVESGPNLPRFAYLMAHQSEASKSKCWEGFYTDPEWVEVRSRTNAGRDLVEQGEIQMLSPVPGLALSDSSTHDNIAQDLIQLELAPGSMPAAIDALKATLIPKIKDAGGGLIGALSMNTGRTLPGLMLVVDWPDVQARRQGGRALDQCAGLRHPAPIVGMSRLPLMPLPGLSPGAGLLALDLPA